MPQRFKRAVVVLHIASVGPLPTGQPFFRGEKLRIADHVATLGDVVQSQVLILAGVARCRYSGANFLFSTAQWMCYFRRFPFFGWSASNAKTVGSTWKYRASRAMCSRVSRRFPPSTADSVELAMPVASPTAN